MKKDVIVSIKGVQYEDENSQPIEVVCNGTCYEENDKLYIDYEEVVQSEPGGMEDIVQNQIRIGKNKVDIVKRGYQGTHLVFQEGESTTTCYNTPFGELMIGVTTATLEIQNKQNIIDVHAEYELAINNAQIADCVVDIHVVDQKGE